MARPKRICSVEECGKQVEARGWCKMHYMRFRRHGNLRVTRTRCGQPLGFLDDVALPYAGDECLIWPFSRTESGYGRVWIGDQLCVASRVVCERAHGPPPSPKHEAAHSCGNGHLGCINPHHLRWALPVENAVDKRMHGTDPRGTRNGQAKLTEDGAKRILALKGAAPQEELARQFGVSRQTISAIHRRENWAWLEG